MNAKSPVMFAARIGGHAHRYLTAGRRRGRVVSSFSGGINLLFEDGEAFVPVQTQTVPLHPWAIEVSGDPLRLPDGTLVFANGGELTLGNVRISLSDAQVEDLLLPPISEEEAAIARRNLPLLARFVEEARKEHPPDPFQPEIDAIVERWHETGDPTVLLDLIGLGAGSTPSGDDVLLGIIAGMSLLEGVDDQAKETLDRLRTDIQEKARARTPIPSAQMLLAACDRSFPEPVLALLKRLTSPNVSEGDLRDGAERVAQLGHHSGLATLVGLVHGLDGQTVLHFKSVSNPNLSQALCRSARIQANLSCTVPNAAATMNQ